MLETELFIFNPQKNTVPFTGVTMSNTLTLEKLQEHTGKEIGISDWMEITQDRINAFAECTEDRQWIHVNPKKAKFSPFGTTIAQGYLILSLLLYFNSQFELFQEGVKLVTNYGLNRVRFIQPVLVNSKIRNRAVLKEAAEKGKKRIFLTIENTVEIEGEKRPAMVAEVLAMLFV
jgi:acyl dehydratase